MKTLSVLQGSRSSASSRSNAQANSKIITLLALLGTWVSLPAMGSESEFVMSDLSFGALATQTLSLGETKVLEESITTSADFKAAKVKFVVQREDLDSVDKEQEVLIKAEPELLSLNPNETVKIKLSFFAMPGAPSFKSIKFQLKAIPIQEIETLDNNPLAILDSALEVLPVYEVRLFGGSAPERWSSSMEVFLRKHVEGLTVRFVNYANEAHIIHGNGAVPHGPTNKPMAPSRDGVPGGVYEFKINETKKALEGSYYCHSHESGMVLRKIHFNSK